MAFNCEVDKDCAEAMKDIFLEVVAALSFTEDALETLKAKKLAAAYIGSCVFR